MRTIFYFIHCIFMKHSKEARSKVYQPDIDNFQFENEDIVRKIVNNRYIKFDILGSEIHPDEEAKEDIRLSEVDLPLLFPQKNPKSGAPQKTKEYDDLKDIIQRALNGVRQGERQTESVSWTVRNLEDLQTRNYVQGLFEKALDFLENDLQVEVFQSLKKKIEEMHKSPHNIIRFVELAHAHKRNKKNGALVCALCNIADALHYMKNETSLQDLRDKTIRFSDFLVENMNNGYQYGEDLEKNFQQKGRPVPVHFEEGSFVIHDVYFDTKSPDRILAKLLRVVDKGSSEIVNDGIRARIFVKDDHKKEAIKWLQKRGFDYKKSKTSTRAESFEAITYMAGRFEGSYVEIQITDEKTLNEAEKGIYRHEVYEEIQKLLLLARLFGSINPKRVKEVQKKLKQKYNLDEEVFMKRFMKFFFKNSQNDHWYSYEYEFRTYKKGIYSPERFDEVIQSFQRDFWNDSAFHRLNDIKPRDIKDILTNYELREEYDLPMMELFLSYLKTKKGIPQGILGVLSEQIRIQKEIERIFNKTLTTQGKVKKKFSDRNLFFSSDVWNHIYQLITPHLQKKIEKEPCFWEYLDFLVDALEDEKNSLEALTIKRKDFFNPLFSHHLTEEFRKNEFLSEQKDYIQSVIEDKEMKVLIYESLPFIIEDVYRKIYEQKLP